MSAKKYSISSVINAAIAPLGLAVLRKSAKSPDYKGYIDVLIKDAAEAGMDVNDFMEKDFSDKDIPLELEKSTYSFLGSDSIVCEIGPGTGCYSRYIAEKNPNGKLYLVDYNPIVINHLRSYFDSKKHVTTNLSTNYSLPFPDDIGLDLVFSGSMFTGLNLTYLAVYLQEFHRCLKPGGHLVFDFFDLTEDEAWKHLTDNAHSDNPILNFTYHTRETVDKLLEISGFEIVQHYWTGQAGRRFVTAKKT